LSTEGLGVRRLSGEEARALIISLYQDLLGTIFRKASPIVGAITVATLLESSLADARERYPFLSAVRVSEEGVWLDELREEAKSIPPRELKAGLEEWVSGLFAAFTILTGEVIVRQLGREVERVKEKLKELRLE